MAIDLRTVILIIGIAHLMQMAVFYHQYRANSAMVGPGWWLAWSAAEVVGFSLLLLRGIPAFLPIAIALQSPIILTGTVFVYVGILRFLERPVHWPIIFLLGAAYFLLHLFFAFIVDDISIRTLLLDVGISVIGIATGFVLYRHKTLSIASSANFNAAVLFVHAAIFTYRSVVIAMGTPVTDVFSNSAFNLLQYFDALIVGLLWTFGFIIMINQRLNAETLEAKAHFEQIFNTSPDAAVITRASDGLFIECNDGFTRISGYTKEEVAGRSSLEINIYKNPADRDSVVKTLREAGRCDNREVQFLRKNGDVINGLMSARVIELHGLPHIISVIRDIGDRVKAEQDIRLKNAELQKLNAEKDKFFSIIAHDLKSPFNSIVGMSELLAEQVTVKDFEGIEKYTDIILQSSHRAMDLLANLMDWSLSQTGRMHFNPEYFETVSLINDAMLLFSDIASQKSIVISKNIPAHAPVFADKAMISTVLRNLISNALKFNNPGGRIVISAVAENDQVTISVADTGVGISDEDIGKLFRIDDSYTTVGTQNEKGTGLGLILCMEFIEKHNSRIRVQSQVGKGSTFSFTLPSTS
ncbi:MAG: ATP-binding protein [Bacteroidota bacterium]